MYSVPAAHARPPTDVPSRLPPPPRVPAGLLEGAARERAFPVPVRLGCAEGAVDPAAATTRPTRRWCGCMGDPSCETCQDLAMGGETWRETVARCARSA